MKAVIQRVSEARVNVGHKTISQIGPGLLVLLAVTHQDTEKEAEWLAEKIVNLRIFSDENGKMNLSVKDKKGSLLVVSQFTLYGDVQKGKRPSFIKAAPPEQAENLYNLFIEKVKDSRGISIKSGRFGAMMNVSLVNDGPVTLIVEK